MKLKNLAAVVMAGMFVTSVAHAADDMMLSDESGTYMQNQNSAENVGSMHAHPAGSVDTGANPDSSNMLSDNSSTNANNDMSADTATGDDDY